MKSLPAISPNACAVRERTADGVSVGRCYHHVVDGKCPRHGDVTEVQKRYRETGRLTDERDLKPKLEWRRGLAGHRKRHAYRDGKVLCHAPPSAVDEPCEAPRVDDPGTCSLCWACARGVEKGTG